MSPSKISGASIPTYQSKNWLRCLVPHIAAQLTPTSFVTVIHAGNSDYLHLLHDLIAYLVLKQHRVHVLDFHRRIKPVYLQQALRRKGTASLKCLHRLHLKVILDQDHALNEYQRLQRHTPTKRKATLLFLIDPSALFGRQIGSVKQAATTLKFQYDVAHVFAEQGYAVLIADAGSREFHRTEYLVPQQLAQSSTLLLLFIPRRIILG